MKYVARALIYVCLLPVWLVIGAILAVVAVWECMTSVADWLWEKAELE